MRHIRQILHYRSILILLFLFLLFGRGVKYVLKFGVIVNLKNILGTNRHIGGHALLNILNRTDLRFGVNSVIKVGWVILYQSYMTQ